MTSLPALIDEALSRREALLSQLESEHTDAYRLFHGTVEGVEGLTVDRYGPQLLVQTFRDPIGEPELEVIQTQVEKAFKRSFLLVYNHRGGHSRHISFSRWHVPSSEALEPTLCREHGISYQVMGRHRGRDPLLYLDFRAARRWILDHAHERSVLNLFAYTCGIGVAASVGGASEVWNLDVSRSYLAIGRENAALNPMADEATFHTLDEDFFPAMRQIAGLPLKGRGFRRRDFQRFDPRTFDIVVLDPPTWAKSRYGAVDIIRDYQSLAKPAILATAPGGGILLATNHSAAVELDEWTNALERCAEKAGRPLESLTVLEPEADFPSFDGKHPLKMAICVTA